MSTLSIKSIKTENLPLTGPTDMVSVLVTAAPAASPQAHQHGEPVMTIREIPKDKYGKVITFRDASAKPLLFAFVSPFHDMHEVELPSGEKTFVALGARRMTAAEIGEAQFVNDGGAWANVATPRAEADELRKQLEASQAEVARLVADFAELGERHDRAASALRSLTAKHVAEEARVATDARVVELATAQGSAQENAS